MEAYSKMRERRKRKKERGRRPKEEGAHLEGREYKRAPEERKGRVYLIWAAVRTWGKYEEALFIVPGIERVA